MDIIYLLVPVAILFIILVVIVFFLAIRSGQFDDLEGPAYRILKDNDKINQQQKDKKD